jgi:two-component system, LytTR family, response regulator
MVRAIIIDDELMGISTLKMLLEKYRPGIKVVAVSSEPEEGIELIEDYKPDVVFLDVNMPRMDGFKLVQNLNYKEFKLIFTTAYPEFAIKAIKHKAVDYLVKPIDIEELKTCVDKILESFDRKPVRSKHEQDHILNIPVKNGVIFIRPKDIVRLKADGSYTIFYLEHGIKHVASRSLKEFEAFLDPDVFYRSHPSHIVNLNKVERIISEDGLFIQMSDGSKPELLKRNKLEFIEMLKRT